MQMRDIDIHLLLLFYQVADTASPANILPDQSFRISVRMKDNSGQPQADPALADGVRLGITVSKCNKNTLYHYTCKYKLLYDCYLDL